MALNDYTPPISSKTPQGNEYQLVDMRLRRNPKDGHWAVEIGEGKNGVFTMGLTDDQMKELLGKVVDRVAEVAP